MLYPSVRVLRGLVVVPDAKSSDALGFTESHGQGVAFSIGERNEPHVFVAGGDVDAINEPAKRSGHQTLLLPHELEQRQQLHSLLNWCLD